MQSSHHSWGVSFFVCLFGLLGWSCCLRRRSSRQSFGRRFKKLTRCVRWCAVCCEGVFGGVLFVAKVCSVVCCVLLCSVVCCLLRRCVRWCAVCCEGGAPCHIFSSSSSSFTSLLLLASSSSSTSYFFPSLSPVFFSVVLSFCFCLPIYLSVCVYYCLSISLRIRLSVLMFSVALATVRGP